MGEKSVGVDGIGLHLGIKQYLNGWIAFYGISESRKEALFRAGIGVTSRLSGLPDGASE